MVGPRVGEREAAEQPRDERAHHRHARRAADQHDLVDRLRIDARVGDRALDRRAQPAQQRLRRLLEFRAGHLAAARSSSASSIS